MKKAGRIDHVSPNFTLSLAAISISTLTVQLVTVTVDDGESPVTAAPENPD